MKRLNLNYESSVDMTELTLKIALEGALGTDRTYRSPPVVLGIT
jgi:hypothetical protein